MSDVIISKICKNEKRRINIEFSKEIEEEILSGNFLSDVAINLAQLVIHKQFPSINGLEHTELGLRKLFSIRKGKFLQIQFGNYHWITVCGSNEVEVSVYDSLNKGSVHRIFLHQITDMVKISTDNIRVNIRPVQQQGNGVDCGLFAIAFVVTLVFGNKPQVKSYDEGNLRRHLVECLKSKNFTPFPEYKNNKRVK